MAPSCVATEKPGCVPLQKEPDFEGENCDTLFKTLDTWLEKPLNNEKYKGGDSVLPGTQ